MRTTRALVGGLLVATGCALAACGAGGGAPAPDPCLQVTCSGHGACAATAGQASCRCDAGYLRTTRTTCEATTRPAAGGCQLFPADHLFNTPIGDLPVHPSSADFLASIGAGRIHLDLGTDMNMASRTYYGIPWNVVEGDLLTWRPARFSSPVAGYEWNARAESDCAVGAGHVVTSPCTAAAAPTPLFPIPTSPLVEGGLVTGSPPPDGDHHLLVVDADACRLWELYHVYPGGPTGWDIYGSATWDLGSNDLRPAGWTSADAAGFPILPLLLRADEASSGAIRHALRFTIPTTKIRTSYTWPARHLTGNGTGSALLPEMGQLFRLKATYAIPASFNTQARAILQAMKTYGMYVADGGSAWFITGEPNGGWQDATFSQVQSVTSGDFEAVDLAPIRARGAFDPDSARVPPP